jgi:hypothetical protein
LARSGDAFRVHRGPGLLLNPIVFPPAGPAPTADQMPYLIALDVMQSLFLGLGISFILFSGDSGTADTSGDDSGSGEYGGDYYSGDDFGGSDF